MYKILNIWHRVSAFTVTIVIITQYYYYDKYNDRDIPWIFRNHRERAFTQAQNIERASRRGRFQSEETA